MMRQRLPMAPNDDGLSFNQKAIPSKLSKRIETQAKFDRLWHISPKQFDPSRNCLEKERVLRSWQLLKRHCNQMRDAKTVDLGSGSGFFSKKLREEGAFVDAVDISQKALQTLKKSKLEGICLIQDFIPQTKLEDSAYDIVVSTDVIAYLPLIQHRLYISELARLVKSDGIVLCSTPLDINTEGGLQIFASLAETEFQILEWRLSYHLLYIRLKNFISFPQKLALASNSAETRFYELEKRQGFKKWWFSINTSKVAGFLWKGLSLCLLPLVNFMKESRWLLLKLESVCRFFWKDKGVSHAAFLAKRRPVAHASADELLAIEPKHKRQLWE